MMVIWPWVATIREKISEPVSLLYSIVFIEFHFRGGGICANESGARLCEI